MPRIPPPAGQMHPQLDAAHPEASLGLSPRRRGDSRELRMGRRAGPVSWIPGPVRLCPGWRHTLPDPSPGDQGTRGHPGCGKTRTTDGEGAVGMRGEVPGGGEGMSDCPRQQHGGAREEALILLGLCQVCGDWATSLPRREGGTCGSRLHSGL